MSKIYEQQFESGVIPQGWANWNTQKPSEASWNYRDRPLKGVASAAFTSKSGNYAQGAFFNLNNLLGELEVNFMFRCSKYPSANTEVLDIYAGIHEACDVYLQPDGRLALSMYGFGTYAWLEAIPVNQTVFINCKYKVRPVPENSVGELAWSLDNVPPTSGPRYGKAPVGKSHNQISKILFGPVPDDSILVYDDLMLYSPFQVPDNVTKVVNEHVSIGGRLYTMETIIKPE